MRYFLLLIMWLPASIAAQDTKKGRVGINTDDPKATLHISEDKANGYDKEPLPKTQPQGVLFPKLTTVERSNFTGVKAGTMIYNTDKSCVEIYQTNGSSGDWYCINNTTKNDPADAPNRNQLLNTDFELTWDILENGVTQIPLQVAPGVPVGATYSSYTSPQITVPCLGEKYSELNNRKFSISYSSGTVPNNRIIMAKLNIVGGKDSKSGKYLPIVIENEYYEYKIPLEFNGITQQAKLTFYLRNNAIHYYDNNMFYISPIRKIGNKWVTVTDLSMLLLRSDGLVNLNTKYIWQWAEDIKNNTYKNKVYYVGGYFQWQRPIDGHEIKNSTTTTELATNPAWRYRNNRFITNSTPDYSWVINSVNQSTNNKDLWKAFTGHNGGMNPCPKGWHVPSVAEWNDIKATVGGNLWNSKELALTASGYRNYDGSYVNNSIAEYWTSDETTGNNKQSNYISVSSSNTGGTFQSSYRAVGRNLRCIKD